MDIDTDGIVVASFLPDIQAVGTIDPDRHLLPASALPEQPRPAESPPLRAGPLQATLCVFRL